MKYSELFEPEPENWGLRGDPFLWRELKEHFGDKEIPDDESTLYLSIFRYCCDRCKVGLNMAETAFVEDYAKGGMSSGEVSCKWWRAIGIPLLLKRAAYEKPDFAYYFDYVFYKTTNTPGWEIAFVAFGPNNSIENIIKHKRKWIETKVFCGTKTDKYYSPMFPMILSPHEMHNYSPWIYSLELNRYFLPDDIIPYPNSEAKQKDFSYEIILKDETDEHYTDINDDLDIMYDCDKQIEKRNCFGYIATLKINDSVKMHIDFCDCYYEMFSNMLYELKEKKYAYCILSNCDYYKFLFWDNGDKIRFKIQNYNLKTQVEEPVDIEMPKEKFIKIFVKMLCELQKNLDKYKKKFKRCVETIGEVDYSKLDYKTCCPYFHNVKYIDHDNKLINIENKSIPFSPVMKKNYQESKKETDNSSEKLNIHYYLDENDFVWVENDKRVYRYNYKTGGLIPTDKSVDLMKWHEFPESELPDMIKLKQNLFSQDISD